MITPTAKRVLVRRTEPLEKTGGGLFIPEAFRKQAAQAGGTVTGTVVAVGPGIADERPENQVAPEQVVAFGKFAGADLQLAGVDHVMLHIDDILGECIP